MSEQEMQNKSNYTASNIQVLEGLEPVRVRPGMYIGTTGSEGFHHLVYEVVDNSIDEAMAGYCKNISVILNVDGSVTIEDDGRGIPTNIVEGTGKPAVEIVLTKLHAGGKFGGGGYKFSGGLHGVGVSVVNALSSFLIVDVFRDGKHFKQVFKNGGKKESELEIVGESNSTGTRIQFLADDTIFETKEYDYNILRKRLKELAFLNKGVNIILRDERSENIKEENFKYEGGIKEYINTLTKDNAILQNPFYINCIQDEFEAEIAFNYTNTYSENIFGYANNIFTKEGGTHIDGFKFAITKLYNEFGKKLKLLKEDEKLASEDVREGLVAIISVKVVNAIFEGQTKAKLGNTYVRQEISKILLENLDIFLEENPNEARALINKCILAKNAREAARKAREAERKKIGEYGGSLPGKLADCSSKNPKISEIYLVEGDSAGGSAKQGRDRTFQAILPLRGKILNIEKTTEDKAMANEEIKSMITAFGCGIKDDFAEDKLRYDKIICMTDADVDGSHIRILILTLLFNYMRPLIENGHVYIAQPPLYKLSKGKEEMYFYSDKELEEYRSKNGSLKDGQIQRYKGLGEMDPKQLWDTTMDPEKRTLLKVTMQDAMGAAELFNDLMGEVPSRRREFIEKNATLVKELDV